LSCASATSFVVDSLSPLREDSSRLPHAPPARLQNRIYAGVVLRVCASEPCESLLPPYSRGADARWWPCGGSSSSSPRPPLSARPAQHEPEQHARPPHRAAAAEKEDGWSVEPGFCSDFQRVLLRRNGGIWHGGFDRILRSALAVHASLFRGFRSARFDAANA
jgi:hypothetical protein